MLAHGVNCWVSGETSVLFDKQNRQAFFIFIIFDQKYFNTL